MTTTIQKWGNSQGIRIPKFILEALHWSGSEQLAMTTENDKIIIEIYFNIYIPTIEVSKIKETNNFLNLSLGLYQSIRFSVRNKWFHGMKQTTACGVTSSMLWDDWR